MEHIVSFISVSETVKNQIPMQKKKAVHHGQNLALLVKLDKRSAEEIADKMNMSRNNLYVLMRRKEFTPDQLVKVLAAGYRSEDITGGETLSFLPPAPAPADLSKFEKRLAALEEVIAEHENDMINMNNKINELIKENKQLVKENHKLQGALEYASKRK